MSEIAGPFIVPGGDGFEMENIPVDPNDVHDFSNISEIIEATLNNNLEDWSGDVLNNNIDIFFQGEGDVQEEFSILDEGETTTEDITPNSFNGLDSSIGTDTLAWMSPDNSMDGSR